MKKCEDYFVGMDCGTDSAGYAVTDLQYEPVRRKGEPMLGVTTFDAANLADGRRANRTARRRLHRRQQRVLLVQELFAPSIAAVDPQFFLRIRQSALWREDTADPSAQGVFFRDAAFTEKDYYRRYPTIHHLISELMRSREPHDVRLVYIACAWLVAHRGHFLSPVQEGNAKEVVDIRTVYNAFLAYFEGEQPWHCDAQPFGEVLKSRIRIREKEKRFYELLFRGKKPVDLVTDADDPQAPVYSREGILKLLCGGTVAPKDVFVHKHDEYAEVESLSMSSDEEKFASVLSQLGDDAELLLRIKALFDWSVLADVLHGEERISDAKVRTYEQHKTDLKQLKAFIRKYLPDQYGYVFSDVQEGNYPAYTDHPSSAGKRPAKQASKEVFCAFLKKLVKDVAVEDADQPFFNDMQMRLDTNTFLPKQKNTDNRVIPYQLYAAELSDILDNAACYLPFLTEPDADGLTVADKLRSIFRFRIPYYVGPLNKASTFAWLERKADKIYPWNFERLVDLDKSEDAFIHRMTGACTYLPGEPVLPKNALCYAKFTVLNEINALRVSSAPITPEQKQAIYRGLFEKKQRVTYKALCRFCVNEGFMGKDDTLTGIDAEGIKSSLRPWFAFSRLMSAKALTQEQAEQIIERITCTEEQPRLRRWLDKEFAALSEEDRLYLSRMKFQDFGRLSYRFLCQMQGRDKVTGEVFTVMEAMWSTNNTLMQLLSDGFTFTEEVKKLADAYYREYPKSLEERMDQLYLSNAVRRPIYRALDIVKDIVKVMGKPPKKIFVEMARGADESQKGKRTKSRREQILEQYRHCSSEEMRALIQLLDQTDENSLQSEKLYLYFMQLGRCMYSGTVIDIERLSDEALYNVDHIYPQSKIKDDSVLNNKVLVLSTINADKGDVIPIKDDIRNRMAGFWASLHNNGLITDEKYRRLTRSTQFTADELSGFINRQLVETRQSTKAIATLLKERYPDTEIVYVKAGLVSEFRKQYDMLKSRTVNDLHHAKDAYLNIVVGNVYHERFNKNFFRVDQQYSMKTEQLFKYPVYSGSVRVWSGQEDVGRIKRIVEKNHIHITRFAFCRKGSLFDQQPLRAAPDSELLPRKASLPTEKYGGYRKPTASFFVLVRYRAGKKTELMITPIDLLSSAEFMNDPAAAESLAKSAVERVIGKPVDAVELPLGARILKVNTVLSVDGFRFALAGKSNGGARVVTSPLMPLQLDMKTEQYVKRLESFQNKKSKNAALKLQPAYDRITAEQNIALYDALAMKFQAWPFSKRPPLGAGAQLLSYRQRFVTLSIESQVYVLIQVLILFSRSGQGSDLKLVGGVGQMGVPMLSSSLSNWAKTYQDVRIIDQSASGLFEKQSVNLLTLL